MQNLLDRIGDGRLDAEGGPGRRRQGRGSGRSTVPTRRGSPVAVESRGPGVRWRTSCLRGLRTDPCGRGLAGGPGRFPVAAPDPGGLLGEGRQHPPVAGPRAFCGKGFHGAAVHRAAIASGVKVSGCTVHFADNTYGTGPIIALSGSCRCSTTTPPRALLAALVFAAELAAPPGGHRAVRRRPAPGSRGAGFAGSTWSRNEPACCPSASPLASDFGPRGGGLNRLVRGGFIKSGLPSRQTGWPAAGRASRGGACAYRSEPAWAVAAPPLPGRSRRLSHHV